MQLYQHSAWWTRIISAEGCARNSEHASLPAFRAMGTHHLRREGSHFENMFQKYCACHEIMMRGRTKCCTGMHHGHAQASSSSSSKNVTFLRNRALQPQNRASLGADSLHPCHVKRNPSNDTRLPTFRRPRSSCACRLPRFSRSRFLAPAMQHPLHVRKRARKPGKTMPFN